MDIFNSVMATLGALILGGFSLVLALGFLGGSLFNKDKPGKDESNQDIGRRSIGMFIAGVIFLGLLLVSIAGIIQIWT